MIEGLRPYPKYHESGVDWLGAIPSHWRTPRLKTVLREKDSRTRDGKGLLLSLSRSRGLIPRTDLTDKLHSARTLVGYKLYQPGEIVMNRMQAWSGMFGSGAVAGLVSPDYAVFQILEGASVDFLTPRLKAPDLVSQFALASKGIGSGFNRLYSDKFGVIPVSLPPPEEQASIVRFLHHANRKIDSFIRAKRKLIALLNEQKKAIIDRAITRGLDPNVSLKPSGVPWLGDIPQHWEVRRAKQVCSRIIDCKNRTPPMVPEGGFTVVRTTNVRNGKFNLEGSFTTDQKNYEIWTQRGAPQVGDVFFTREAPVGEACLVPQLKNLCMGQRMMYFRPDTEVLDSEFLLHSIYGPVVRTYVEHAANGSTVGHLRLGQVYSLMLLWCPLKEQKEIIRHINFTTAPQITAITRCEREIDFLQEFRIRLTADVVTGKLDVGEAVRRLPARPAVRSEAIDAQEEYQFSTEGASDQEA